MGGLVALVFFGLAGIFWTVLTAAVWVRRRSLPLIPGGLAATCTVFIAILLVAGEPGYSGETATSEYSAETTEYGAGTGMPEYSLEVRSQGEIDDARAWARTAGERARVDRLHQGFAPALERYRQVNGHYPSTLEEVGFRTPDTPYGSLHYYSGGEWYLISFGDPSRNGFSADWDSRPKKWIVTSFGF
jgi:hypothetical protein